MASVTDSPVRFRVISTKPSDEILPTRVRARSALVEFFRGSFEGSDSLLRLEGKEYVFRDGDVALFAHALIVAHLAGPV